MEQRRRREVARRRSPEQHRVDPLAGAQAARVARAGAEVQVGLHSQRWSLKDNINKTNQTFGAGVAT